ncbi:MAG: hypothetical protein H0A75_00635 [Candidatus Methanofishera endochildressiae]|uniref:Copper chaperone n=1 Tax=Candidatus Methanofishera endochildressiae TaxID=2738884 RepID=A0A7Z0SCC5_9GAMM|nr:hypothetical protein [Candidatus Methanofishera endochildressiae]
MSKRRHCIFRYQPCYDDWVEIEYDETVIDEDAVIEIIEDAGFTVVD